MSVTSAVPTVAVHKSETLLFFTLLELAIIIGAARLAAVLARRIGQSAVVGEIIAGIVLGPWPLPGTGRTGLQARFERI